MKKESAYGVHLEIGDEAMIFISECLEMFLRKEIKSKFQGWIDGSVVKRTECSFIGPVFNSHTHTISHNCL